MAKGGAKVGAGAGGGRAPPLHTAAAAARGRPEHGRSLVRWAAPLSSRLHRPHQVALLDKETFPRDKICGDAVCTPAIHILEVLVRRC